MYDGRFFNGCEIIFFCSLSFFAAILAVHDLLASCAQTMLGIFPCWMMVNGSNAAEGFFRLSNGVIHGSNNRGDWPFKVLFLPIPLPVTLSVSCCLFVFSIKSGDSVGQNTLFPSYSFSGVFWVQVLQLATTALNVKRRSVLHKEHVSFVSWIHNACVDLACCWFSHYDPATLQYPYCFFSCRFHLCTTLLCGRHQSSSPGMILCEKSRSHPQIQSTLGSSTCQASSMTKLKSRGNSS